MKRIGIAMLATAIWSGAPLGAHAAGLGRLTVLSPLGQPLNAEIEVVSLQPGEEASLSAKLASVDAFRQAGIDFSPVLSSVRFQLERQNRRSVLRVTTTQPVNEPFVDLLVELQWNAGRLVREYTILLDPPEYRRPQAVASAPATKVVPPQSEPLPAVEKPAAVTPQTVDQSAPPSPAAPQAPSPATYEVKRGDTLGEIARRHLPPGVTLNQMMIALYRANQDAFIRENVNLIKTGRILNIPAGDSVGTVDREEATRLVQAHRAEWEEYRSRLAAAPTAAEKSVAEQAVQGAIEAKPEPTAPESAEEKVRLSKVDPQAPDASSAAQEDDAVARERALKEAQSRVTELEKNLADLQKLLELKNQQLAALEKGADGGQPIPAAASPATAAVPTSSPAGEAGAAKANVATSAAASPTAAAPAAANPQASAKPKPKVVPPPPPAPSLLDELLADPMLPAGGAGVVVLLLGYGLVAWRRKKASQTKVEGAGSLVGLEPAFVGQDQAATTPAPTATAGEPSVSGATDEVDPVQEANVYLAYGRDAQAEEILKEAVQRDPQRLAAHAKLLEIYAQRKDTRSFEKTALVMKSITNGTGPEWEKAAALGRGIDSANALYGAAAGAVLAAAAVPVAAAVPLDFDLGGTDEPTAPDITFDERKEATASVDFDLGSASESPDDKGKSDFTPEGTLIMGKEASEAEVGALDFDLDLGTPAGKEAELAPQPASADVVEASGGLDFDLDLDLGTTATQEAGAQAAGPALDLSHISLDLGATGDGSTPEAANGDPKWQEVATKLDLAKAYEEMGDREGARELLSEVMKDGDATQKGEAEHLLAKLS